ncbi:MAG: two-component sensor histidine kinase [Moraxellaceae bacterium]|nr:MAG: two-component sensor histidine kinase [Moraxellaceae bacterium]
MLKQVITPGTRLIVATCLIGLALLLTILCAIHQPYSGLSLAVLDKENPQYPTKAIRIISSIHAQIPVGAELVSLRVANQPAFAITDKDLVEDPHFLESYAAMQQLFDRQTVLYAQLKQHQQVRVGWRLTADQSIRYTDIPVARHRPVGNLPVVFWFQLAVSSLGFLLGCWIWALRPHDLAAKVFAVQNAMYPVFAFAAAIYSTRDLALDGQLLHGLVIVNTAGALLYGSALVCLFLVYPKVLVRPAWLWLVPAFFVLWLLADSLYLLPEPSMGGDLPVTLQMLGAIVLALWQWRINCHDPRARAALRWFAACILVSCGLFVFLVQSIQLLGVETSLSQGYAFGFFLLVTIGIAVGLKRYRLFELDQWAFGILFWLAGAIVLVLLDALLIMVLSPMLSFGLAVLICGLLWLPVRGLLQRRFLLKDSLKQEELFQVVLDISFANTGQNRRQQWQQLLERLFQPLEIEEIAVIQSNEPLVEQPFKQSMIPANSQPLLAADGLALILPAIGDIPALRLQYPRQGRSLFSGQDCNLTRDLITLIQRADDSRFAYDRGVCEERSRIARDLHDDIGSRLLSGLHQQDLTQTKQVIRQSIADMRTIISGMTGQGLALTSVLDALHQETRQRLQEAGIALDWVVKLEDDSMPLNYQTYKNYISIMRELLSNIIKYAQASSVLIHISQQQGRLVTVLEDNGSGFDLVHEAHGKAETGKNTGQGINNLRQRLQVLNGQLEVQSQQLQQSKQEKTGTRLCIQIPLAGLVAGSTDQTESTGG